MHPYYNSVSRRSQTTGRNSCLIVSEDVSNCSYHLTVSSHEFACQFDLALCEKPSKPRGNLAASASVYFKGQRPAIVTSGAGRHGWLASNSDTATAVCMCVGCVQALARVRAHGCACLRLFVRAGVRCLQYIR